MNRSIRAPLSLEQAAAAMGSVADCTLQGRVALRAHRGPADPARAYSINRSAASNSGCGTRKPSSRAVFMFSTSS